MRLLVSLLLLLSTACLLPLQAQEELPEYDQARRFAPQNAEQFVHSITIRPNYFPGSARFWYKFNTSAGDAWYIVDPASRSKQPLFDNAEMAAQLSELTHNPSDAQHLDIKNLRLLEDGKTFAFSQGKQNFKYTYQNKQLVLDKEEAKKPAPRWGSVSPDKKYVVYGKGYDLYMMSYADYQKLEKDPKDSTVMDIRLTTTGVKDFSFASQPRNTISDGSPVKVDLERRTRASGYWSPDSKYFVQIVQDQRMVKDLWVINSIAEPRPTLETYKYQMPGEEGPVSHLYVFDIEQKQMKEVNTGGYVQQTLSIVNGSYQYDPNKTCWTGANDRFFVVRMSRDLKHQDVCTYTFGQDSLRSILHEDMNTSMETRSIIVLNKGEQFIHWSERDGWGHLYLYNKEGQLQRRLTKGPWHVEDIQAVDEATRTVYFMANGREAGDATPYYEHLYKVSLNGGSPQLLTPGNYFHLCYMDRLQQYAVDNYSRVDCQPAIALYDNNGRKVMDLEKMDMSDLMAQGYKFPELFTCKAADGVTDLYGIMYKPYDFDSTKVYPVIDYVYPGPQTESTFFRYLQPSPRTDRLAQAGFIVIAVGHRGGHPARSKWYHNFGYGNLRDYPLADHKSVIEQLCAKNKFMDVNRVGIHGHSGGGFMSTAAMLVYPDFFKVAVSCAGNHDNNIYNRWWGEKHHGVTEKTDKDGNVTFDGHVPTNQELAKNLKGHLLLIHGDVDNNVHPGNSIRVVNELIRAGKRFDMLIMPGKQHHFEDYNEYFYWRMVDYFSQHLKGQSETSVDIKGIKLGNWFQGYQE